MKAGKCKSALFPLIISFILTFGSAFATAEEGPPRQLTPQEIRKLAIEQTLQHRDSRKEVESVVDTAILRPDGSPLALRIYTPAGQQPLPVLVFLHGGGWVLCNLDTHDNATRDLANGAGCIVVAVDYRLAPEHKFPAALEDAFAALKWTAANAASFGGDPERLAVGGESAGGNLSAAVSLMARNEGGPKLVFQLLAYPVTNLTSVDTESYRAFADSEGLSRRQMQWFINHYLARPLDGYNIYASPLLAHDLSRLPPALVITGGLDVLRDEGAAYARRLREADVETSYSLQPDKGHGGATWAITADIERNGFDEAATALRAAFAKSKSN
ncbi:MAG: alpha/beta hydrolase [Gemmatimonadetes bacterium]|jgi:acetyl esterase|nr:alpha/beta hydrolase [Gemmatimonadota bacterium]